MNEKQQQQKHQRKFKSKNNGPIIRATSRKKAAAGVSDNVNIERELNNKKKETRQNFLINWRPPYKGIVYIVFIGELKTRMHIAFLNVSVRNEYIRILGAGRYLE